MHSAAAAGLMLYVTLVAIVAVPAALGLAVGQFVRRRFAPVPRLLPASVFVVVTLAAGAAAVAALGLVVRVAAGEVALGAVFWGTLYSTLYVPLLVVPMLLLFAALRLLTRGREAFARPIGEAALLAAAVLAAPLAGYALGATQTRATGVYLSDVYMVSLLAESCGTVRSVRLVTDVVREQRARDAPTDWSEFDHLFESCQ